MGRLGCKESTKTKIVVLYSFEIDKEIFGWKTSNFSEFDFNLILY